MIIVEIKDGDNLDKALRKYKRKFERLGILKETRRRMYFTPKSVQRREEIKKAARRQQYMIDNELT